jgi:hypothetical protein
MDMMKNFQKFKSDMEAKNPGMNPQDMINKMMASGQVTQAQFEQARSFASMLGVKM